MTNWNYFERFEHVNHKYLPEFGEGETMATQIVTAVNRLIYKWYNDGDVYDNRYCLRGWCNDLSDAANWLAHNVVFAAEILTRIYVIESSDEYEDILRELAEHCLDCDLLERYNKIPKLDSIYDCPGEFVFEDNGADYEYDEGEDW